MIESAFTLPLLLKAARVLIPVTAKLAKHLCDTDNKLLNDIIELAIDKSEDKAKDKLEAALKQKPDVVLAWHQHVFIDYTGWVLGQLVQHLSQQPQFSAEKEQLEQLAEQAPEGWRTFVLKGSPGLSPVHREVFLRQMAAALSRGEELPPIDTVPFITFFNWHVRLSPSLQERLATHLRTHLDNAIQLFLVSDYPKANQAYKQIILSGINNSQRMLRDMQAQLSQFSELLTDLRGSPGFDLDHYADKLHLHCERIPFSTKTENKGTRPITLSAIFVEPTLRAHHELEPDALAASRDVLLAIERGEIDSLSPEQQRIARRLEERQRESPPVPAFETLFAPASTGHVILAHAGVGKTSLVRRLALRWAAQQKNRPVDEPVVPLPLLIELKTFASAYSTNRQLGLLDFLHGCEESIDRLDRLWCLHYLRTGAAVLILDGLDEVSREDTRLAIANGASRLRRLGIRVLVTSRRQGFIPRHWQDQTQPWSGWLLDEFSHEQREQFIQLILPRLYASDGEVAKKQRDLKLRFEHQPAIGQLSSNPLLLTLITVLQRIGRLGDNRIALYKEAADLLLDQWEAEHFGEDQVAIQSAFPCTAKTRREIVRRLALKLIDPSDDTHFCFAENLFGLGIFQDAIREVVDPKGVDPARADLAATVLPDYLNERHSVLCYAGQSEESGERLYSFIHRTFLEFFIALAWVQEVDSKNEDDPSLCRRFLMEKDAEGTPRWQDERFANILPFYFGLFSELDRDSYLEARLPVLAELWQPLTKTEEDTVRQHDAILFAAEVWGEIAARDTNYPDFGQQLRQQLQSLALTRSEERNLSEKEVSQARERGRRAVRALARLWSSTPSLVDWLETQLHESHRSSAVRQEIVWQLSALHGPSEALRTQLQRALSSAREEHMLRNQILQAIDNAFGSVGLYTALDSLPERGQLKELWLDGCTSLRSLEGLPPLPLLNVIDLVDCTGLEGSGGLAALAGCPALKRLNLTLCTGLRSLEGLPPLPQLERLDLSGCTGLEGRGGLFVLAGCPALNRLTFRYCTGLRSLERLPPLSQLEWLDLSWCSGLEGSGGLAALAGCPALTRLDLINCTGLRSLEGLPSLQQLASLNLYGCTGVEGSGALIALAGCPALTRLDLRGCTGLRSLEDLPPLPRLETLDLEGCSRLEGNGGLAVLVSCPALKNLDLRGCNGLTDEAVEAFREAWLNHHGANTPLPKILWH
ncbi:MAG: NACHT domain-containing protein [Verrucomicrobiaceae bacterium]|nr:NACHT domain-containing protein [Verrucomicrobiaceae bacterium]